MIDDEVKLVVIYVLEEYVEVELLLLFVDVFGVFYLKEVEFILREINLNDFSEVFIINKILRGELSVDLDGGMIFDEVVILLFVILFGIVNGEKE